MRESDINAIIVKRQQQLRFTLLTTRKKIIQVVSKNETLNPLKDVETEKQMRSSKLSVASYISFQSLMQFFAAIKASQVSNIISRKT